MEVRLMFKNELLGLLRNEEFMKKNKTFALEFELPGHPANEIILNQNTNANAKADYIDKVYDENLINTKNPEVKIVSVKFFAKSIHQIL